MKLSSLFGSFSHDKTAPSHLKNLIEMAAADGHFHDSEKELLKSIAKRNGISESQLTDIQSNPAKVQFEAPKDEKQRFLQLYDLVQMMSIDNHIHQDERSLANLLAIKFGYKREIASELVEAIRQNIKNGNSGDEAHKRLQMMMA